jgi:predicted component of type VI protein secretion system
MREVHLQALWVTAEGDSAIDPVLVITRLPWIIGRSATCDSQIEHPLVSRRHCGLFQRGGEVWVRDYGSQNGTRLNGEWLTEPRPLREGDQLEVACLPFLIQLSSGGGALEERLAAIPAPSLP